MAADPGTFKYWRYGQPAGFTAPLKTPDASTFKYWRYGQPAGFIAAAPATTVTANAVFFGTNF